MFSYCRYLPEGIKVLGVLECVLECGCVLMCSLTRMCCLTAGTCLRASKLWVCCPHSGKLLPRTLTPLQGIVCVCVCVCVCRSSHYSKRTHSSKRKYHSPSMCVCVCLCVPFHRGGARARGGVDAQYQYGILNTNGIIIKKINSAAWHGDSSGEKKIKKMYKK